MWRQRRRRSIDGPGPWDRGLALVVDSSEYGPQVHAIHRVVRGLNLAVPGKTTDDLPAQARRLAQEAQGAQGSGAPKLSDT